MKHSIVREYLVAVKNAGDKRESTSLSPVGPKLKATAGNAEINKKAVLSQR